MGRIPVATLRPGDSVTSMAGKDAMSRCQRNGGPGDRASPGSPLHSTGWDIDRADRGRAPIPLREPDEHHERRPPVRAFNDECGDTEGV